MFTEKYSQITESQLIMITVYNYIRGIHMVHHYDLTYISVLMSLVVKEMNLGEFGIQKTFKFTKITEFTVILNNYEVHYRSKRCPFIGLPISMLSNKGEEMEEYSGGAQGLVSIEEYVSGMSAHTNL